MRAVEVVAPHRMQIVDKPIPEPAPGQVRVRVHWAGVCGTDYSLIGGKLAFARYPMVPGHEFSGRISAVGEGVSLAVEQPVTINPILSCRKCAACLKGDIHHCDQTAVLGVAAMAGGFADQVVVPADAIRVLPQGLPMDAGAMAEPVAVAVQVARVAGVRSGDRVAVIGAGNIGLLVLQMAALYGASRVAITDPVVPRLRVAQSLGAEVLEAGRDADSFDVVIDGVGRRDTLVAAVRLAARGGRIVVYGVPTENDAPLPMLDMFRKDLRVAFARLYPASFDEALAVLRGGKIDWNAIVTHRVALEAMPEAVAAVTSDPAAGIKILVRVNEADA